MTMLIDSHCHLDYPDFTEEGVAAVVDRARAAGVGHCLTISCKLAEFDRVLAAANASPYVHCTVGTHPHHAGEAAEDAFDRAALIKMTQSPKVVGIGETGLDYFYDHAAPAAQHKTFAMHIEAGLETDLPLVIHTRDAEADTMRLLRDVGQGKSRGVMHCFSGSMDLAEQSLDIGYYISFSGIITFKKADDLREVVKRVPLDRMLVETDAPYLAPIPFRGKRNEPAFVKHTAEMVAQLKGVSYAEVAARTTENFYALFSKAKEAAV